MCIRTMQMATVIAASFITAIGPNRSVIAEEPQVYRRDTIGIPSGLVDPTIALPKSLGATPKVYVLILGYARDGRIGPGIVESGRQLEEALETAFPASALDVQVIGIDRGLRRANASKFQQSVIEAKIAELRTRVVEQQDTLFCYVMTHGAFDGTSPSPDNEYGHWFQTENEVYPRLKLMQSLLSAKARLTVLLSDACNVRIDAFEPLVPEKSLLTKEFAALRTLLLDHRGQVDISASSQGQFSFYGDAGVFTTAFLGLARTYRENTTWQEFYSVLQAATQAEFDRTFQRGCPYAWDEKTHSTLKVLPTDARAQKELRPFSIRPITWVVHERQHTLAQP